MINAYPLSWPPLFSRTKTREHGRFKSTLSASLKNVQDSLRLFSSDSGKKLENLVISSNVTLGSYNPSDAGVSVWFVWDGLQVCIPVDRYLTVEANLQAIHYIIEARRVELRHGTLALVRASFTGFLALPSPTNDINWRDVLGVNQQANLEDCKKQYKILATQKHPDKQGGNIDAMIELNNAWTKAQDELK